MMFNVPRRNNLEQSCRDILWVIVEVLVLYPLLLECKIRNICPVT